MDWVRKVIFYFYFFAICENERQFSYNKQILYNTEFDKFEFNPMSRDVIHRFTSTYCLYCVKRSSGTWCIFDIKIEGTKLSEPVLALAYCQHTISIHIDLFFFAV